MYTKSLPRELRLLMGHAKARLLGNELSFSEAFLQAQILDF